MVLYCLVFPPFGTVSCRLHSDHLFYLGRALSLWRLEGNGLGVAGRMALALLCTASFSGEPSWWISVSDGACVPRGRAVPEKRAACYFALCH